MKSVLVLFLSLLCYGSCTWGFAQGLGSDSFAVPIIQLKGHAVTPLDDFVFRPDELSLLGIEVKPLDAKLAAQMNRPAAGLLVNQAPDSAASNEKSIRQFDIIIQVNQKNVSSEEELRKEVLGHSGKDLDLVVVRAAKELPICISVPSVIGLRDSQSNVNMGDRRYRLGVMLASVDEVLRSHLNLETGTGLIVTDVVHGGPAEKVGIEANDILLELDSEPIRSEQDLREKLQICRDREIAIKLIRRGKQIETKAKAQMADEPQNNAWIDLNLARSLSGDIVYRSMNSDRDDLLWTWVPKQDSSPKSELAEIRDLLQMLNDRLDKLEKK